ncbi:6-phosphogluconolactonase, partial [bacterium]|nr:6-phosphogluconolactonase [bacterium]
MKTKTINNKEFAVFDNMEDMSDFAMEQWSDVCRRAIEARGIFTVALSGGSTPITLYQKLAARDDLPWDKTHFFIVDERFVPYDSTASNFRMINRALLLHISVPAKNIHPILTVGVSAASAAEKYERDIAAFFKLPEKTLPSFDLILLGMGEDGHTASLFP